MQQGLKNSNSSKMRWLYVLMSIDIDVCFCLNVLIKSQETFVFSKTILQVFSFKEVFTKMWHQISYHFINYPTLLLTNRTLEYNWKPFYPPGPFFNFLIPFTISALICAALNSKNWVRKTVGAAAYSASFSFLLPSRFLPSFLTCTQEMI